MKKIVLISSYCNTDEKIAVLKTNIETIKNLGLDVMLNSPISLPLDVINKCDYFFLTKDNPLLTWPQKAVSYYNTFNINNKTITRSRCFEDYGWANLYQVKKLSEFALTFEYDYFYHIIYDLIIDNVVIDAFKSETKKCNFFHFHEWNVSLQLMIFDKPHLIKFISQLTLDRYLELGGVAEECLDRLLKLNIFDYTIEESYVDDKILFNSDNDLFNYSKIDGLKFFIVKNMYDLNNILLFFYNIEDPINIKINNRNRNIINCELINIGGVNDFFEIEYNNKIQNISDEIKNIVHNTISIT